LIVSPAITNLIHCIYDENLCSKTIVQLFSNYECTLYPLPIKINLSVCISSLQSMDHFL